ncbi:HAMP domain-containing histidine kinase, partial [Clostridiaceae bacterium UIB06]|nr:HAMP domain-containing histidine kinase [Clostridiaceae bacterium UIB06]
GELLYNVVKEIEPRATRNNISIKTYLDASPLIKGDRNRLKQVFINILDNSLKFTESEGTITLNLFLEQQNIIVSVEDTGCGIDPEQLPQVLTKFYKGNTKKSGSGIGLAICDEIIKLHGGDFKIESAVGIGTKTTILLKQAP